jgi:hypothetical protein
MKKFTKFEQDLIFEYFKTPIENLILIMKVLDIQKDSDQYLKNHEKIAIWWERLKKEKKLVELKKQLINFNSYCFNRKIILNQENIKNG